MVTLFLFHILVSPSYLEGFDCSQEGFNLLNTQMFGRVGLLAHDVNGRFGIGGICPSQKSFHFSGIDFG